MIFIPVFLLALLFNLYVLVFGKKDLEMLGAKISIKGYLAQINLGLVESLGESGAMILKVSLLVILVLIALFNLFSLLLVVLGVIAGTYIAKRLYQIPSVASALHQFRTFVKNLF